MLVTSAYVMLTRSDPAWKVLRMLWLLLGRTQYQRVIGPVLEISIFSLTCALPQLLFALFGGWLFREFRLVITQQERVAPRAET
jgi:hypothetical protein